MAFGPGFDWRPTIGDPSVMGWLTVALYVVASWLCLSAFRAEKRGPPRPLLETVSALLRVVRKHFPHPPTPAKRALIWLGLAVALAFLAINKQLDLQTLLTEVGRFLAHRDGWYGQRRELQALFIIAVAGISVTTLLFLFWVTRGQLRDLRLPLYGFCFIVAFVLVRASSFHKFDRLIGWSFIGVRMNWVLELSGIVLVIGGALRRLRQARRKASPPSPESQRR